MSWKNGMLVVVACGLICTTMILTNRSPVQATEQGPSGAGPARYTVVETQGNNLLVTDNAANKLYYYTIDKGAEVGSDLKLRGFIDLTQVGKPEIKISKAK